MEPIRFQVRLVAAGTGSMVWDHPFADRAIQQHMPPDRRHGPMIGIVHLGLVRPTPNVLRDVVVTLGEEVKAGRYGDQFSLVVSSEDEATRHVIRDIAAASDIAMFVGPSSTDLRQAEPVGALTAKDRETMGLVLQIGGTVTATQLACELGCEQTAAGNRLTSLHKKGYLQRQERPHPLGDLFLDPRSVRPPDSATEPD